MMTGVDGPRVAENPHGPSDFISPTVTCEYNQAIMMPRADGSAPPPPPPPVFTIKRVSYKKRPTLDSAVGQTGPPADMAIDRLLPKSEREPPANSWHTWTARHEQKLQSLSCTQQQHITQFSGVFRFVKQKLIRNYRLRRGQGQCEEQIRAEWAYFYFATLLLGILQSAVSHCEDQTATESPKEREQKLLPPNVGEMAGMSAKMERVNGLLLLFQFVLLVSCLATVSTARENCYNGPAPVIVNNEADVYLGVLLNVREMDIETPGKCGTGLHREAIELYESLRWYLSFINQNSGQVASRLVKDSFIPGIQLAGSRPDLYTFALPRQILGLKIFDACGDADLAERQLGVLFPELVEEEELNNCNRDGNSSSDEEEEQMKPMLGLIDFVGLVEEDPEIGEQLASFSIPFMAVRLDDFLPADEVAEKK
ncbi:hypothetical protein DAPPUDRAFT_251857 [Daphnia pulex]|uniref:Uncharacterized protein n=1 Tax=Daphnia pulex TaxID=6669 RepID=E9H1I3_DAPPU|nr:hypothetical protein DAPPUDRAFT_251857 [Daphnia pulex]|eukprot:EFX74359.1 hypothetical protein DAPPUDRAFT_251857 [Daphnia pulex]